MLVEALQDKINLYLQRASTKKSLIQIQWRQEVTRLIVIYQNVAHLYNWQDQFCKYIWYLHEAPLNEILTRVQGSASRQVIALDAFMLGIAFEMAHSCGADFCIYSNVQVK